MPFRVAVGDVINAQQGKNNQKGHREALQMFKKQMGQVKRVRKRIADGQNILFAVEVREKVAEGQGKRDFIGLG